MYVIGGGRVICSGYTPVDQNQGRHQNSQQGENQTVEHVVKGATRDSDFAEVQASAHCSIVGDMSSL